MTSFDILLLMIAGFLLIFLTVQRMLRALITLVVTWLATFVASLAYREATYRIQAVTGENVALTEGIMFVFLFVLSLVVGYLLMHSAFPVTKLPKLGVLDYIMGFVLGAIVTALVVAVIQNGLGLMVREVWEGNEQNYVSFATMVKKSALLDYSKSLMKSYGVTFKLFFRTLPPALLPQ